MNNNLLSFLGLALRGGRLEAGEEPVTSAAQGGRARLLLAASDASGNTLRRVERLAEAGHCLWLRLPFSKEELGGALGRSSVAMAAVTDLGMASAAVRRLAAMDPEQYGDAAARMELKVRRAAERKTAPPREKQPSRRPAAGPRRPGVPEGRGAESFHHKTDRRRPGSESGEKRRSSRPGVPEGRGGETFHREADRKRPGPGTGGREGPRGREKTGAPAPSPSSREKRPHGGPHTRTASGRPQERRRRSASSPPGRPDRSRGGRR